MIERPALLTRKNIVMVILTLAAMLVALLAPAPELMRFAYAAVILAIGVIFVSYSVRQDRRAYDEALNQAELMEYESAAAAAFAPGRK